MGSIAGIGVYYSENVEIRDSLFKENKSLRGTGVGIKKSENIVIKKVFFEKNYASNNSGGIFVELSEKLFIYDCLF